ncbi:MAG: thioesterase [Mycobacterium sp.]|nr:thioesterase [Mycobacterium sp.]
MSLSFTVDRGLVAPGPATTPPPDAVPPLRWTGAPPPGSAIPPHYGECYGCGVADPPGLRLRATAGEGVTVRTTVQVAARHQGAPGLAHGGLIATAFDETLGYLMWLAGRLSVTGRLEVDYRRPVPVGSALVSDGELLAVHGRKSYAVAVARLDSPEGPVVASASGLFIQVPTEHFSRHGAGGLHFARAGTAASATEPSADTALQYGP